MFFFFKLYFTAVTIERFHIENDFYSEFMYDYCYYYYIYYIFCIFIVILHIALCSEISISRL